MGNIFVFQHFQKSSFFSQVKIHFKIWSSRNFWPEKSLKFDFSGNDSRHMWNTSLPWKMILYPPKDVQNVDNPTLTRSENFFKKHFSQLKTLFFLSPKLWRKNRVFDFVVTYMTILQIRKWDFKNRPYSNFWNKSRISKVWPITWRWRLVIFIFLGKTNFLITLEDHTCSPWRPHIFIQIFHNSNPVFFKYLTKIDQSVQIHPSDLLPTLGEDFSIT